MREESQDSMESYGINQDTQGGVMTGLWPSSPDPKSFPMPDVATRPISETEAFEDTVKSAYASPFNLTNTFIRSALYDHPELGPMGQELYNQAQKQHKEWKANLQTDLQTLPTSDRHWYSTGWLPSMIGGLADPITMIAGGPLDKGITTGLAKLAPSASKLLAEKAGESAAKGIAVGAARGGAAGLATGATLGGAETLLNNADPDNDHVSLAQYAQNTFGWGFFGALGGGILGGIEFNKAANMVANAQASLGKSIDTEANTVAALNEDRNNFTPDKQKTLSDDISDLRQKRDDTSAQINDLTDQIKSIPENELLNMVHTTPPELLLRNLSNINKVKDDMETADLNVQNPMPALKDLGQKLQTIIPGVRHFSKLKKIINTIPDLRTEEDTQFVSNLSDPQKELDTINKGDDRINEDNQTKMLARKSALENYVSQPVESRINPLATDILPKLKSHLDDLTATAQDLRTKLAQQKYLMQPADDLAPVARRVAENLGNDTAFSDPSTHADMETQTDESAPYQTAPITDDEQDKVIEDLKNQGALLDSDYDELNRVNEAEEADKGKKVLFQQVISCLLKRGLDGR